MKNCNIDLSHENIEILVLFKRNPIMLDKDKYEITLGENEIVLNSVQLKDLNLKIKNVLASAKPQ